MPYIYLELPAVYVPAVIEVDEYLLRREPVQAAPPMLASCALNRSMRHLRSRYHIAEEHSAHGRDEGHGGYVEGRTRGRCVVFFSSLTAAGLDRADSLFDGDE